MANNECIITGMKCNKRVSGISFVKNKRVKKEKKMKKFLIVLFSLIITTLLFCGCKQDNFQDTDTYSEYSDDNFYDEEESTVRYDW